MVRTTDEGLSPCSTLGEIFRFSAKAFSLRNLQLCAPRTNDDARGAPGSEISSRSEDMPSRAHPFERMIRGTDILTSVVFRK